MVTACRIRWTVCTSYLMSLWQCQEWAYGTIPRPPAEEWKSLPYVCFLLFHLTWCSEHVDSCGWPAGTPGGDGCHSVLCTRDSAHTSPSSLTSHCHTGQEWPSCWWKVGNNLTSMGAFLSSILSAAKIHPLVSFHGNHQPIKVGCVLMEWLLIIFPLVLRPLTSLRRGGGRME